MKTDTALGLGVALLSSAILSGCGGGGGGSASSPATASVEGAYLGTISNGLEHNTVVLDDGQYYTLYGTTTSGGFAAAGFIQGSGQANNGSFSSSNLRDYFASGQVQSGTLSASYTATSLNGSVTEGSSTVTFTGAPIDVAVFNYNSAANLASITGSWNLTSIQNESVSVNIAANGTFSAFAGACSITGAITPRASGKNVFNVTQTFGSACALPGQSASGIALTYLLTNGKRQLIVAETTASRANGTLLFGVR